MSTERCLAFSALCHAGAAVDELANGQLADAPQHLLDAVFRAETTDLNEIFAPRQAFAHNVGYAADLLQGQLSSANRARYTVQLLKLAKLLKRNRPVTQKLRELLIATPENARDAQRAALIYRETVSTLSQRIQVMGDRSLLHQTSVAESIRATLLAGIRFAWLWEQLGGRQWHLLLQRRRMLAQLSHIHRTQADSTGSDHEH